MEKKSESIWIKATHIMWHQGSAIITAFLLTLPATTILIYLYPQYAPLLFLTISINQISLSAYYSLLLCALLTPLILLIIYSLITLSVSSHIGQRPLNLLENLKKTLRIIPSVIASLWTWTFIAWLFNLLIKLGLSLFSLPFHTHNLLTLLGYIIFYIMAIETTRSTSFAIYYHLFQHLDWQEALTRSILITQQHTHRIRRYDTIRTLIHLFVPCLVMLFSTLTHKPIQYFIASNLSKLGILCFIHITFSLNVILRTLLFVNLKQYHNPRNHQVISINQR